MVDNLTDAELDRERRENDTYLSRIQTHRAFEKRDLELEALIADIKIKNRQHATEIWKVVLATAVASAVLGGFIVSVLN